MHDSQKLAIAAHLHVLLRRKTGRVTDIEWMAENAEYAQAIIRFARARAEEDKVPELREWADRLEVAVLTQPREAPRPPLVEILRQRGAQATPAQVAEEGSPPSGFRPSSGFGESGLDEPPRTPAGPRYVGGLR